MQASFVVEFCVIFRHDRLHLLDSLSAVVYRGCFIVNSIVENFNLVDLVCCAFGGFLLRFQNSVLAVLQLLQSGFLLLDFLVTFVYNLCGFVLLLIEKDKSRNRSDDNRGKEYVRVLQRCKVERLLCGCQQAKFLAKHHYQANVLNKHLRFLNDIGRHKNRLVCSVSCCEGKNGFNEYIVVLNCRCG